MDNVTHSLVGLAIGEAAWQISRQPPSVRRRIWILSAVASNLPDIDVLYRSHTPTPIDYLLEHRGFTHTWVGGIPQALLVALVFWLAGARKSFFFGFVLALVGVWGHIGCDWFNSYGVHPFWPWYDGWMYGDSLFIVEPLIWMSLLPLLFLASSSPLGRSLFGGLFLLGAGALWGAPYVPWVSALAGTLWALGLFAAGFRQRQGARLATGWLAALAVTGVFSVVSLRARSAILEAFRAREPDAHLDDIMLTPMPSNFFCWNVITADHASDGYRLRRGTFAPYPAVFPVGTCPRFRSAGTVVPLGPVAGHWDTRFKWEGEYRGRLADLVAARAADCQFAALLRFARAPYLVDTPRGKIAGDLRFDFGREPGFSAFRLPSPSSDCPASVPPWREPRRDWLEAVHD